MPDSSVITDPTLLAPLHLFQGIDPNQLLPYLSHCRLRTLLEGELLISPDIPNQHIYIILSGRLSVRLSSLDHPELNTIGPGECVGELSLLDRGLPTAYVLAAITTQLLVLDSKTLWTLVETFHPVARNLLYTLCRYMRNNMAALAISENDAHMDTLTNLPNRRAFDRLLARCLQQSHNSQQPLCLIMADVDHFKHLNDNHGHSVGDVVLKLVGRSLREHIRTQDIAARFGGEEFAILLPQTTLDMALVIAERVRRGIATLALYLENQEEPLQITISLGVAEIDPKQPERLIHAADLALYQAKRLGRNRVCAAA